MKTTNNQDGFTLSELLIVMLVTGFFVTLIMYFTFSFCRYGYLLAAEQDSLSTRLNSGDILREQLGTSSGLIIQNSIPDVNRNNPDPTDGTGQYWVKNHAIPGNLTAPTNGTTQVVYFKRFSSIGAGTFIMNGTQPYEDEYVLYINGAKRQLLLRSLANTSAAGNRLKTSCPPAIATSACPADKVLAESVSSIDMRYFSRTGNIIDWTSIYDAATSSYAGPDYPVVDVIELKLNLASKPIFQKTDASISSTTIRIALRNS